MSEIKTAEVHAPLKERAAAGNGYITRREKT